MYTPQTWTNGAAGGTPLSAARLTTMEQGIQYASGVFRNVEAYGATGDGTTDDTTALQNALTACSAGDTLFIPGGTYKVTATLIIPGGISIQGGGGLSGSTSIQAATGVTDAVMAAYAWYNNSTSADNPVRISGIQIDGNSIGTSVRGLVLTNFWSRIEDVQVKNTTGHGIELNDTTRSGTNTITNSASENTITRCRFDNIAGDGIHQESNNGASNQDGRISECYFSTITKYGIYLGRAAGWYITNNHLYTIGYDAINLTSCYATTVAYNYVEDFGGQNLAAPGSPTFGYYNGICLATVLDTRASIVVGNTVSTAAPSSPTGNRWTCYYARAGSGQTRAMLTFVGNSAVFAGSSAPATPRSYGVQFGESGDSSRLLSVEYAGNLIENTSWWQTAQTIADTDTVDLRMPGRTGIVTLTDGATVALDAARGRTFRLTAAGSRTLSAPTNPADGQEIVIAHTASGANRTLTLTTGSAGAFKFGTSPAGPLAATTSGTTDLIYARYSLSADRWYVTDVRTGF